MKQQTKPLVIGLGTGRCGTDALSHVLNILPKWLVYHEAGSLLTPHFGWLEEDTEKGNQQLAAMKAYLDWLRNHTPSKRLRNIPTQFTRMTGTLARSRKDIAVVGDVAMYYLPYVRDIIKWYGNDVTFVCMQRGKEGVVKSFLDRTKGLHPWSVGGSKKYWWKYVGPAWDQVFPKFDTRDQKEACEMYWDYYYEEAEKLQQEFPDQFKIFHLEKLSDKESGGEALKALYDFCNAPNILDKKGNPIRWQGPLPKVNGKSALINFLGKYF